MTDILRRLSENRNVGDFLLALVAGVVLVFSGYYVFVETFQKPYPGISLDGQWHVLSYEAGCAQIPETCQVGPNGLVIGDQVVEIQGLTYQEYAADLSIAPFRGIRPGTRFQITVLRDGEALQIPWVAPGPVLWEILGRLMVGLIYVLPFWLSGTIVLFLLRPRGLQWRLLVILNYLMAGWLVTGLVSASGLASAALLVRALSWVLVPIFLHFHITVPPQVVLEGAWRWPLRALYVGSVVAALWTLGAGGTSDAAFFAFAIAILLSVGSLLWRILQPNRGEGRPLSAQIMLLGIGTAFGPAIILWAIPSFLGIATSSGLLLNFINTSLVALPFFYIYALYRRSLGNLEFRANRILSTYGFVFFFATAFVLTFLIIDRWIDFAESEIEMSLFISVVFLMGALYLRPYFMQWVNRFFYGSSHTPDEIVSAFADEISRALSGEALITLLRDEVVPSLFIRESALIDESRAVPRYFYADTGAMDLPELTPPALEYLDGEAGKYRPHYVDAGRTGWIRLVLPVTVGGKRIGLWIFGRRDPDDFYPDPDVALLKTLSNQVGIALETIRAVEDLRQRADELQRAYNELRELDRLKEEFVQNISHELRTPLTLVHGYAELLKAGSLGEINEQQQDALGVILDRTDMTIHMVEDIISVQQSMLDELRMQPLDLKDLALQSVHLAEVTSQQLASPVSDGAKHEFMLTVPEGEARVCGDRKRLQQVLDNLLNNAVKFSPAGGLIEVQIKSCHHRFPVADGRLVSLPAIEVCVLDSGVGISLEQQERIWERFYQADGSTTRQFGGIGLGLAIVADTVTAHRGFYWVESQVDQGASFYFVLPTVDSAERLAHFAAEREDQLVSRRDLVGAESGR